MQKIVFWFNKITEGITGIMLGIMFFTFILQIAFRYFAPEPLTWTLEVCLTLWIWIVFFGNSFILKEKDHITFDVIYNNVSSNRIRKLFSFISSISIVVALLYSLLPTWDYIDFMQFKTSATLEIPLKSVFCIYALFIVMVSIKYIYKIYLTFTNKYETE